MMLRQTEVSILLPFSRNKSYEIIRKLKAKNKLKYKEAMIPLKMLCAEYGLDVDESIQELKENATCWNK